MKITVTNPDLVWPDKCAACGNEASSTATAKCIVGKGVIPLPGLVIVRSRVLKVPYPVCAKHKWTAVIFGQLSQRNSFNLALGVLSVIFLVGLGSGLYQLFKGIPADPEKMPLVYWALFPALYWVGFFVAKRQTPVKVADFGADSITFEFANNEYCHEFKAKNS